MVAHTYLVIRYVKAKNIDALNKLESIRTRGVIELLRNDLDDLEYFFAWYVKWCEFVPGADSHHFQGVKDNRTFDIYHKYGFSAWSLYGDCITEEQWAYLLKIGYITKEQYTNRCS